MAHSYKTELIETLKEATSCCGCGCCCDQWQHEEQLQRLADLGEKKWLKKHHKDWYDKAVLGIKPIPVESEELTGLAKLLDDRQKAYFIEALTRPLMIESLFKKK